MNAGTFVQQLGTVRLRAIELSRRIDGALPRNQPALAETFDQLEAALQELQATEEELLRQYEQLEDARRALEAERQRYRDLFEFAPDAYLLTDAGGTILDEDYSF